MFGRIGVVLLSACWAVAARAEAPWQERLCLQAATTAERANGLPSGLLRAIGLVESGRSFRDGQTAPWPWTLNVAGVGAFYPSRAAALVGLQAALANGPVSVDVGCFQINLAQHPGAFRSLSQALDPAANAGVAARFLVALRRSSGTWDDAVARYHTASLVGGTAYRTTVLAAWTQQLLGRAVSPTTDPHVIHVAFFTPFSGEATGGRLPRVIGPD